MNGSTGGANQPQPPGGGGRYFSLDFLRGSFMLLGILSHTAMVYATNNEGVDLWSTSEAPTFVIVSLHGFRMPLFFILAGFFAALLISRRSQPDFTRNRLMRIGLPFLLGYVILVPVILAGFTLSLSSRVFGLHLARTLTWDLARDGEFFFQDMTAHLWFLYYLLFFYGVMLALAAASKRLSLRLGDAFWDGAQRLIRPPSGVFLLSLVAAALLFVRPLAHSIPPLGLAPDSGYLALYGFFFGFGVLLYRIREVLADFSGNAWLYTSIGLGLLAVYKLAADAWHEDPEGRVLLAAGNGVMVSVLFYGLVGLALRYLERPIPAVRYVADASYWSYLIHLPFVAWFIAALDLLALGPNAAFAVLTAITVAFCFLTYDLFVRGGALGAALNGRRYRPALAAWFAARGRQPSRADEAQRRVGV